MTWTTENLRDNMLICAAQTQNQCKCSFSNSSLFTPLRLHPTLHFWKTITKESRWDVGAWWSTPWLQLRAQVTKLCTVSQRGRHVALSCPITSATKTSSLSSFSSPAILQKYLDNFDLSIKIIYILGTLGFSIGTGHNTAGNYCGSEGQGVRRLQQLTLFFPPLQELLSWPSFPMCMSPWWWSAAWASSPWASPTVLTLCWDSTMKWKRCKYAQMKYTSCRVQTCMKYGFSSSTISNCCFWLPPAVHPPQSW